MTIQPIQRLYLESDMDLPESSALACGRVIALCRKCPGKESPNDDSAAVVQTESGGVVLIVADGVGGGPQGHKASAIAVQAVADRVGLAQSTADLRPAILDGIEQANTHILELAVGAATTIAVVEIQDKTARSYQVGDSMSLVIGQRVH